LDNINNVLDQLNESLIANSKIVSVLGARAMVLGKFLDATLPYLTRTQRAEVLWSFRLGIEEAMSLMDDVQLSAEYHSTLLDMTNSILAKLGDANARPPRSGSA